VYFIDLYYKVSDLKNSVLRFKGEVCFWCWIHRRNFWNAVIHISVLLKHQNDPTDFLHIWYW